MAAADSKKKLFAICCYGAAFNVFLKHVYSSSIHRQSPLAPVFLVPLLGLANFLTTLRAELMPPA